MDLHTKRTGHTEFTDKTMEAAKPIDLEAAPPKPAGKAMDVDASASAEPQGEVVVVEMIERVMICGRLWVAKSVESWWLFASGRDGGAGG